MRFPTLLLMLVIALVSAACAGTGNESSSDAGVDSIVEPAADAPADSGADSAPMPVVIDSDGAFDDLKAIMFLLERPDVEVLALTMSGTGVAHCPAGAQNVSAALERVGAPNIPVACGSETPLRGENEAPTLWRAAADSMGGVELPEPRPLADAAAPELLAETILASEEDVVLVALGPLTNIAEAIESDDSFLEKVEMVYLMGGAVDVDGNVMHANPKAEFNIWADPYAAAILFDSDVPITLVPLDATNAVPVTPYLYDAVAAHSSASPVAEFVAEYLAGTPLFGGLYHWDELAAVVAVDASAVTFAERHLDVVEEGGPAAGATVETENGRPVRVAVTADRDVFEAIFYEAIIGTNNPGVTEWTPDAKITWDGTTCSYVGPDQLPNRPIVQIDNLSSDVMSVLTGAYAPGTTSADWGVYRGSGDSEPPDWWLSQGLVPVPGGAHDVWALDAGEDVTAICFIDSERVWELAGPTLAEAADQVAAEPEYGEAKVTFEDTVCAYEGPDELSVGTRMSFEFETSREDVALIVVAVHDGTTWDEITDFVADNRATIVPPFVDYVRIEVQTGAGTIVDMAMQSGTYLVTCNTAQDSTDTAYPAALIQIAEG